MSLRILIVHNYYQQPGGEDAVVRSESELLRRRGHDVVLYKRDNDDLNEMGRAAALADTLWSRRSAAELSELIGRRRPDVIHCHNTFPLVSPSAYWAAGKLNVPVVQTLHNFRLLCPAANFLRDGKPCEDCLGRLPLSGVRHRCYRGSLAQSGALAAMLTLHRGLGTYRNKVARYIALNDFCRRKFVEGGLPASRVVIKPNFVDARPASTSDRSGFLFVGRLSPEKGVHVMARAVAHVPGAGLRVAGAGPEASRLEAIAGVTQLGMQLADAVQTEMARAMAMIAPSIWYEAMPMAVLEAYASGLPVIASRIGSLAELVQDGKTGLLFAAGDAADLAEKMRWALAHPAEMADMGRNARALYEAHFTPEQNYDQLMAIYRDAIAEARAA